MIKRIESLHKKNLIYRDIKPENFMIGIGKGQITVFIIDFGLVKRYKDARSGNHI
jgi:casein kinase 1